MNTWVHYASRFCNICAGRPYGKAPWIKRHPKGSYNRVIERLVTSSGNHDPKCAEAIQGLEEELDEIMHHLTNLKKGL